jgi:hypothetical protein
VTPPPQGRGENRQIRVHLGASSQRGGCLPERVSVFDAPTSTTVRTSGWCLHPQQALWYRYRGCICQSETLQSLSNNGRFATTRCPDNGESNSGFRFNGVGLSHNKVGGLLGCRLAHIRYIGVYEHAPASAVDLNA